MKKACIFDLDGTLTQTLASIARPTNMTLRHFGLPEMPVENFRYYAGDGIDTTLRRALRDAGDPEGRYFPEGIVMCRKWYQEDPLFDVKPYPHIVEALSRLREMGILLAVCSNKPHENAVPVVETIFGPGVFSAVQGQTDLVPMKPDPTGVLRIMETLKVRAEDCLYAGDTDTDMKTGKNAGLFTVGVAWGFRDREELEAGGADRIIDDPLELLELI